LSALSCFRSLVVELPVRARGEVVGDFILVLR
jgi:hypothetical protein